MAIRMVVFDMAGTTVWDGDDTVATSLVNAIRHAGTEVTIEDVDPVMGMPKPLAIRTLIAGKSGSEPPQELVDRVHQDFQARIVEHYRTAPTVREIDGATEVFASLRALGILVTLDTGFDRTILDTIVERLGWADLLDATVSSDEVEHGRPAPDLIHLLMERLGINDPAEVAKIGDSESDLEEGVNAGCGLIAGVRCRRTQAVFSRYPAAIAVDSLREFVDVVESQAGAVA